MISEISGGAFDITVGPLVRAWGFGADRQRNFDEQKLDSLLNLVGMDKVKLVDGKIVKSNPNIIIDFNAISKGFSVDVVARYLNELGIKNYLIEIGGELRTQGTRNGNLWKVGIDKPEDTNFIKGQAGLQAVVSITNKSMATSGNYRRFYIEDGVKYSHTIDPKTGYPIKNRLLSVTVLANECAIADGIATVCMVLGHEKAIEFINSHPEYSAFMIYSGDNGEFETWLSDSLKEFVVEN
jgi:thiamine biosynthesis lipoprotein